MKKFISFALAASMALSMVPATAFAASDLTASHSNIRVTANTEFYPKKVADADASLTTREVPYILLEATTDFKYDEQTFVLALENAEWLERKDDGDKLFVETDEYMTGEDGVKFKPAGSTTTPGGTTTPTLSVADAMKAYTAALNKLVEADKAYQIALGNEEGITDLKNALQKAQTAYDSAVSAAEANADSISGVISDAELAQANKKALDEALAKRATQEYVDDLIACHSSNYANVDLDSAAVFDSSSAYTDNDLDPTNSAGFKYAHLADTAGAVVANGVVMYFQLQQDYLDAENSSMIAANGSLIEFDSQRFVIGASNTSTGKTTADQYLKVTTATITGDIAKMTNGTNTVVELSPEGEAFNAKVDEDIATAKAAIERLEEIEKTILETVQKFDSSLTASDINSANISATLTKIDTILNGKQVAADKAQAEQDVLDQAVADAKAELDKAQEAFDGAASAGTLELKKAADAAAEERKTAGANYMTATVNAGNNDYTKWLTDTDATDAKTLSTQYQMSTSDWNKVFNSKAAVAGAYDVAVGTETLKVEITKKSDSRIIVHTSGYRFKDGDVLSIPLFVRTTGGTASVSIDSLDSEFTSQGKTFAKTADGDTELSIEKVQNFYDDDEVKNLYLEELVAGTIEPGKYISLRVNGDFNLKAAKDGVKVTRITGDGGTDVKVYKKDGDNKYVAFEPGDEADEIYLYVEGTAKSTKATQYRIQGLKIVEDGADFGDEASITVSGGGTSKQTIKIGNYEDFGVKLTAEDKDLPVIYAGAMANSKYDNQTLKVTIEETVANSFIDNRKMEITLPEGVEFVNDSGKRGAAPDSIDDVTEDFKVYNFAGSESDVKKAMTLNDNGTKITISGKDLPDASGTNKDRKRKIEFSVHVSAEADFTGDVVMTLGGPGVADKNVSATVATVKAPIEVRTAVNELKIDYRNTEIADITLVEPEAGLWAKDDIINLEGERMSFESGAKAEVVNGDMKLDKYDGDYIDVNDGVLSVKVSSRSSKTPAEIKISGLSLYMDRSLAAGNYKLKVFGEAKNEFFMNNYDKDGDDFANVFETQKVTVMDDFVKIVTAGRDKDDATFTTKIVVPVGGDTITAGTKEIKLSEMQGGACPPAYINNDGYTMLPVRAVVEALNEIATVRWDDATKTCTIGFGQRVFSMTVGSKVLNLNGVSTALNAAPENKDGRVFLPLRDLGYALGLSDSQISWDSTTQTAQLN